MADYYHETLKQSPEALEYLETRGLDGRRRWWSASSSASRTAPWATTSRSKQLEERPGDPRAAAGAGYHQEDRARAAARQPGGPDPRRPRPGGADVRAQDPRRPAQGHAAAPLPARPSPRRLEPRRPWRASKEIILCEALIDALTFWCARLPQRHLGLRHQRLHRRASGGLQGLRHRAGADRLRPRRATASRRPQALAERLGGRGHRAASGCSFPHGMDANEYALKVKPAGAVAWRVLLRLAAVHGRAAARRLRPSSRRRSAEPAEPPAELQRRRATQPSEPPPAC